MLQMLPTCLGPMCRAVGSGSCKDDTNELSLCGFGRIAIRVSIRARVGATILIRIGGSGSCSCSCSGSGQGSGLPMTRMTYDSGARARAPRLGFQVLVIAQVL